MEPKNVAIVGKKRAPQKVLAEGSLYVESVTVTNLVTDTGSEEGGREAALELPSDWGVEAKAGRMYLITITDHFKCLKCLRSTRLEKSLFTTSTHLVI